jgi:CubicO group peptidase (beta-lactamase class C family)
VDVGPAFVADTEAAVLVQPGDRALDDPALLAELGAVWLLRSWDRGADPAGANYVVLGLIVEKVTGRRLDRVLVDRVVRVLGLPAVFVPRYLSSP